MNLNFARSLTAITFAAFLAFAPHVAQAQYGGPPPPTGYAQGGWDQPPAEFQEIQRQGFHDGVEGARRDFDNHRPPNVLNRDEFRHPHVPPSARADYRLGFHRGYDVAMNHLLHEARGR